MKKYLVQIRFDGEISSSVMSERELADLWEQDDISGIGYEFAAFDVDTFGEPIKINVYKTVQKILREKREIEQEYRDYCEAVNEYGYDFEIRDFFDREAIDHE